MDTIEGVATGNPVDIRDQDVVKRQRASYPSKKVQVLQRSWLENLANIHDEHVHHRVQDERDTASL